MTETATVTPTTEEKAETILAELITHLGGARREPQVNLAKGLARHMDSKVPLLVQAPTGVGKSFAAIAAARASGEQTLIATHTHGLQQQLQRDSKMLAEATGGFTVAVLKGRSSYFCRLRGDQAERELATKTEHNAEWDSVDQEVDEVLTWAQDSEEGEKSELDFPVSSQAWGKVSVSSDGCIGTQCPFFRQCFSEQARARAKEADITILNHAIMAQDMKKEQGGLCETFPNVIFDECHELPSVVGEAYGATIISTRLLSLVSRASRIATGEEKKAFKDAVALLQDAGKGVNEPLRNITGHKLMTYVGQISSIIARWVMDLQEAKGEKDRTLRNLASSLSQDLSLFMKGDTNTNTSWIEWRGDDNFTLRNVMFNTGTVMKQELLDSFQSVSFMSGTVKVGNSFNSLAARLGLSKCDDWQAAEIPHLFNYRQNGMVWLPERMKNPSDPAYLSQVAQMSKVAIKAAGGRTLVLCTSWKSVRTISETLKEAFDPEEIPVLVQEPGVNLRTLAERFRENPRSVLVGTRTLWTGMSFEGDTCACVIIDKVPFPSPGDPVIAARCEKADEASGRGAGFGAVMVPEASMTIAQGAGRLIRTPNDRGVLVLPDPRLNRASKHYKSYGKRILDSLPPMPVETDTRRALEKLKQIDATSA